MLTVRPHAVTLAPRHTDRALFIVVPPDRVTGVRNARTTLRPCMSRALPVLRHRGALCEYCGGSKEQGSEEGKCLHGFGGTEPSATRTS
jgi:hypothetical protein